MTATLWNPALGHISSRYGQRGATSVTPAMFHAGTDIANTTGTAIVAPERGTIVERGVAGNTTLSAGRSGNYLILRCGDIDYYFGHLDCFHAAIGNTRDGGQLVADMGATGNVTGPHLHLEVRKARTTTTRDPQPYFADRGVTLGTNNANNDHTEDDVALTPEQENALAQIPVIDANLKLLLEWNQIGGTGSDHPTYLWQIRQDTDALLKRAD